MLFVVSIYSRFVGFRRLGFLCTVFGLGFKLDGCLAGVKFWFLFMIKLN